MTTPCEQADSISHVKESLGRMEKAQTEERVERRDAEKRLIGLLEKVADQGARMTGVEDQMERHDSHLNDLYTLVRQNREALAALLPESKLGIQTALSDINAQMVTLVGKINMLTGKHAKIVGAVAASIVLSGAVADWKFHSDWMNSMLDFVLKLLKLFGA